MYQPVWLLRRSGRLVCRTLLRWQGSSVCPPPYSGRKVSTSLNRPSSKRDHHGRAPGGGGHGLKGPNKPWVLGKMQKSGSLQIYLWLSACPALKNRSAKGRYFMQNQGALYVPAQADNGASWGLWGLFCPCGGSEERAVPMFPCWVKPKPLALEAWFPRPPLIPDCNAS